MTPESACLTIEAALAAHLPHRFTEHFTLDSFGCDRDFLTVPPRMIAELIRWAQSNPDAAAKLAAALER